MKRIKIILLCLSLSFLLSCQSKVLKVHKLDNTATKPQKGFVYPLQFMQFEVKVTRGIANCQKALAPKDENGVRLKDKNGKEVEIVVPDVRAFVKAEISSTNVDDADNMYVVDSDSLSGATKISDLTLEWKDGRLLSVNASADDQTSEIISSVTSGVGQLAISSINPLSGIPVADAKKINVIKCRDEVIEAVSNVKKLEASINAASKQVAVLSEKITKLQHDLAIIGRDPTIDCVKKKNADETQCNLKKKVGELNAIAKNLEQYKKSLATSFSRISNEKIYRWPKNSKTKNTKSDEIVELPDSVLSKWIEKNLETIYNVKDVDESQLLFGNFKKEFNIYFGLERIGSYGIDDLEGYSDQLDQTAGIRYRVPANGYLVVCKKKACDRDEKTAVIAVKEESIFQLGHIFHVPFVSKPFTNNELSLEFDENGLLKKGAVIHKEAAGENIANTFKGFAAEVAAFKKAEAETEKSEIDELKEQTALLVAQKELIDAQNALNPIETTIEIQELNLKTELAEAQKKYADALKALEPETSPQVDPNDEAISVINAETNLLLAEAARLEALLEVKRANEALNE